MSLTLALNTALSGLRTTQSTLAVISNNVSNANTDGYTRKVAMASSVTLAGMGAGVKPGATLRTLDGRLQADAREAANQLSALEAKELFLSSMQQLLGKPGDDSTVAHRIADLAESIDALAVTPESATVRNQAIEAAQNVARQ